MKKYKKKDEMKWNEMRCETWYGTQCVCDCARNEHLTFNLIINWWEKVGFCLINLKLSSWILNFYHVNWYTCYIIYCIMYVHCTCMLEWCFRKKNYKFFAILQNICIFWIIISCYLFFLFKVKNYFSDYNWND